jgi:hypothetical protein
MRTPNQIVLEVFDAKRHARAMNAPLPTKFRVTKEEWHSLKTSRNPELQWEFTQTGTLLKILGVDIVWTR